MRWSWLLPFLTVALADSPARAADSEQDRRTFFLRYALGAGLIEGSQLVGHGSRERFTQATASIADFRITRVFPRTHFGIDFSMNLMVPGERDAKNLGFGQFELAGDLVLARGDWGYLMLGAGGGGDFGRYWWDGRAYPLVFLRDRIDITRKTRIEFEARTIPVAVNGKLLPMFEQRFELGVGYGYFTFGMRFNWTVVTGGQPQRSYEQHELGAFAGFAL